MGQFVQISNHIVSKSEISTVRITKDEKFMRACRCTDYHDEYVTSNIHIYVTLLDGNKINATIDDDDYNMFITLIADLYDKSQDEAREIARNVLQYAEVENRTDDYESCNDY